MRVGSIVFSPQVIKDMDDLGLEIAAHTSAARRDKLCELRLKLSEAQKEIKRLKARLKQYERGNENR